MKATGAVHARGIPCGSGSRWGSSFLRSNADLYITCKHKACQKRKRAAVREEQEIAREAAVRSSAKFTKRVKQKEVRQLVSGVIRVGNLEHIIREINREGWTVTFSASGYAYVSLGHGPGQIQFKKMMRPITHGATPTQSLEDVLIHLRSRIDSEA